MKTCSNCKTEKPLTDFNKKSSRKDGRQAVCRVCSNASSKKYYRQDKPAHIAKVVKRNRKERRRLGDWIRELKSEGCTQCDENDPCCIDFHHLDPSKKNQAVARMVASALSQENIQKEIDKCVRLCSNCHRKFHAGVIELEE